jgi:tetratricopeptide (TPR) repeat protein
MVAGGVVGLFAHNTRLRAEIERTQQQETETARQKAAALEQVRRGHQALDDIFTSLDNAPVGMSRNAAFRAMYEEQAKAILRFYHDTLQTGDVADPEVRLHRGLVSVYAGRMQQRLGNPTAAEVDYRQAQELLASLAKQPDAPPAHRLEWANCCYWFGTLLQQTGRLNDAEQTYNHAVAVLTPLEASGSVGERDRRVAALCYTRMVENEWRKGRHETAARHAHEATARWDQFLAADPDNELHRLWATQTLRYHAMAAWMSRNWDDLDAVASRADIEREWYARHPPGRRAGLTGRVELGELYHSLGVSASERGDMPAAVTRLSQAINLLETVLQVDSTSPDARIRVATIFRNRAMIRGGTTEALADWDRAVELTDGELAVGYRIERAAARLVAGDWKRAVNELDAVAAASLDGIRAKELGQAFARAAEVVPEAMRDGLKVKAVAAVRRAVEKGGFPNREAFREYLNNPVFAAIRTWAEFDEWERKIK